MKVNVSVLITENEPRLQEQVLQHYLKATFEHMDVLVSDVASYNQFMLCRSEVNCAILLQQEADIGPTREQIATIKQKSLNSYIMVMTLRQMSSVEIKLLVNEGAQGVISAYAYPDELMRCFTCAAKNELFLCQLTQSTLLEDFINTKRLEEREQEILAALSKAMPQNKTATMLNMSMSTLSYYKKKIIKKLQASSLKEAIDIARVKGML